VAISIVPPGERAGVGRPPRPGPTGLVQIIVPLPGHTWKSLQREWNEEYEQWRYESVSNFNRDAKNALNRLLWPGWITRADNQELQWRASMVVAVRVRFEVALAVACSSLLPDRLARRPDR
jgi:hypothetical protein